jgi:acetyl esterase/lipase
MHSLFMIHVFVPICVYLFIYPCIHAYTYTSIDLFTYLYVHRTADNILQQFPPTLLILAKNDILLDEGVHFAEKLNRLNKPVETLIYNDSVHSFFFRIPLTTEKVTLEISAKIKAMIR